MKSFFQSEDIRRRIKFAIVFAICYLILFGGIVGWRDAHLSLLVLVVCLTLVHRVGFTVVLALSGLLGWLILYESMTFLPNYKVNPVHVKDLYDLEVSLFGVMQDGIKISLNEWWSTRIHPLFTLYGCGSYLLWIPAPMVFAIYLMLKDKKAMTRFAWAYFITNVFGVIVYYLYPAAPPWYYLAYGDVVDFNAGGSEALLAEFDKLIGIPIFHDIYGNSSNTFGAMPSLHCAYPTLGFLFAYFYGHRKWAIFFAIMAVGTYFGAIYSQHHYMIDVIMGILCAIITYFLMNQVFKTSVWEKIEKWFLTELNIEQARTGEKEGVV